MNDLDNAMDVINTIEERNRSNERGRSAQTREFAGVVEHYYKNIGVVAIKLEADLKVGDIIEIGDDEEAVRQRVSSMQIDRKDVNAAYSGDSIGIKMKYPVDEGSNVYKM